jgi:hypothetical protein
MKSPGHLYYKNRFLVSSREARMTPGIYELNKISTRVTTIILLVLQIKEIETWRGVKCPKGH